MASSSSTINDQTSKPFILIWLNPSANSKEDLKNILEFIKYTKIFVNVKECEQYIKSSNQERFVLIVTGQMGRDIVPRIHQLQQILSIYIYCVDVTKHERWSKEYQKVKGVIIKIKELTDSIRSEYEKYNHNQINELPSISIFKKNIDIINESNNEFIYMKCLIDFLLKLKPIERITNEFIDICEEEYKDNPIELDNIHQFKENYSSKQALLWFKKKNFLLKIINKSFNNENIDLLYLSRFYLHDLYQQIKQNRYLASIQVYRSHFISKNLSEKIQNSIGNYILISSFFSADIDRDKALSYFDSQPNSENSQKILFEIQANPLSSFCSSSIQDVLFNLGSIFHVTDIKFNENQIWIIRMISCDENDFNWKIIIDKIKTNDNYWTTDLLLFGTILQERKKYFQAEKFYRLLLNEFSHDHQDIDACYYSLGFIFDQNENYQSSLKYYQLSLEILLRKNQLNHSHLGIIYYMIGEIYRKQYQFNEALEFYNKSLIIWKETFDINQIKITKCLNNIAFIYRIEKKYLDAISYYTEVLNINEKYLSNNHIDLGILNHNIGALHWCLGHYDDAIKYYNLALEIKNKSFTSQHSSIAMTLENLGLVYENNQDFRQAFNYYKQAAEIYRKTLPSTHPDVMQIDDNLRRVSSKL